MFSYLRPHKRGSTPSSPAEQPHSSFEPPLRLDDHGHPQRWADAGSPESTITTSPPFLPPIQRVSTAGQEAELLGDPRLRAYGRDSRTHTWDNPQGNTRSRDTFTHSNHQKVPFGGQQRPESAGNAAPSNYTASQNGRAPTGMNHEFMSSQKSPESAHSFGTSADIQERGRETGRRPTGARLHTPPPAIANTTSRFEPAQQKSGKTRLNLLNPMSLLARRRTSNIVPQLSPEALAANRAGQTQNLLDFQRKGTVVHDFSAPRGPRKNGSYNDVRAAETGFSKQRSPNPQYTDTEDNATSPWSGGNHTPVFTENFEEEQYPAAGPHVRKASDLTDLPLPMPPYAKGASRPIESNTTSISNEAPQKQIQVQRETSARILVPPSRAPPVPPIPDAPVEQRRISIDPAAAPPKSNPSAKRGRHRNVSDVSAKDAAIPKHMKSTSSRFSFDMIGAAEQERLLEDRHRQRALEKKAEDHNEDEGGDFDDFDYDDMMNDDGLEERIPGVNADLEDDMDGYEESIPEINYDIEEELEEPIPMANVDVEEGSEQSIPEINADMKEELEEPTIRANAEGLLEDTYRLGGFTFQQALAPPLSPHSPGMVETPRDGHGEVIGFAMTKNSPQIPGTLNQVSTISPSSSVYTDDDVVTDDDRVHGLGLQTLDTQKEGNKLISPGLELDSDFPEALGIDDDDLYFDDGIITGSGNAVDAVEFDESIFDNIDTDAYGRPLKPFSTLPTLYAPPTLAPDTSPPLKKIDENYAVDDITELISPVLPPAGGLAPQPSVSEHVEPQQSIASVPTHGLTENSLATYQSALAAAAFAAAANGKFRRDSAVTNTTLSEQGDPHPGLVTDSSHTSHYEPFSSSYEIDDDFDYDDVLAEDDIIAAANAEALANDCDGFYGQEFGFYSAPAAQEAEYANGGYFGPRGVEGINRSQSGRVVSREPNLTPITERSEYSNRNSFMSLNMHGPGSITSPGLAQLAGMMSSQEFDAGGDMSLEALLKLRRGAWGGSQASLHSSNGSPKSAGGPDDTSPNGTHPPWAQGGAVGNPSSSNHRRKNSAFSLASDAEDSPPGSPTLTMSIPMLSEDATGKENLKKHKHSGSMESISYLKEEDPVIGERWILERRRTCEDGGVEVLGREVVKGGRI
ncbi:hypothetical protein LOCC1_G006327 [Lachnellula occidentalis]|uniref:Uncharacterized protein n=1 Tax=Lachnellula occidentalis TaxID=215460 RepID=A0A8H8UG99_9HELO|nr:hypothetical protein LOCC1_G006327 [Lachnellula occidentalis]